MSFDELFNQLDDNMKVSVSPEKVRMAKKAIRIPVLGNVAAGIPIEAIEDVIDYEEISEELAHTGDFFALKIEGDSMEPRICNGDVVIVRKQNYAESGDLVIVLVNGDSATCKSWQSSLVESDSFLLIRPMSLCFIQMRKLRISQ